MIERLFLIVCFLLLFSLSAAHAEKMILLVPMRNIYPGQAVDTVKLNEKSFSARAEIAPLYVQEIRQVVGKVAKNTLIAGKPIAFSSLGNPVLLQRGQETHIIFSTNVLTVSTIGVVLQSGAVGDFIRIRNKDSGRTVGGIVMENGSVQVGIQ